MDQGGGKRRCAIKPPIRPARSKHRVVEIGIGEAAPQLQPRDNPLNEDAALLKRHAVGCGPDRPELRIGEGEHAAMVLSRGDGCQPLSCTTDPRGT